MANHIVILKLNWTGVFLFCSLLWIVNKFKDTENFINRSVVGRAHAKENEAGPEERSVTHQEILDHKIFAVPSLNDENFYISI